MLQPLPSLCKSFLATQRGSRAPQRGCRGCCIPPPKQRAFRDRRGEQRCPAGGMEERRLHATQASHVQGGQKHQPSPVSSGGVLLTYLSHIKGKVRGVWGKNETFMTVHI